MLEDNQNAIKQETFTKKKSVYVVLKIIFVVLKKYIKSNKQQSNLYFFTVYDNGYRSII
jgi:hypothetical protein